MIFPTLKWAVVVTRDGNHYVSGFATKAQAQGFMGSPSVWTGATVNLYRLVPA